MDDVDPEKPRPELADAANAHLAAIVSSSFDAIISKTLDGQIVSWNDAATRMLGYLPDEIIGKSVRLLIPADRQVEEDRILERLRIGERIEPFETIRMAKDGRQLEVSLTISPIYNSQGRIIAASKILRDISDQKRTQRQIQTLMDEVNHRARNLLTIVLSIARQTAQKADPSTFVATLSDRIASLSAGQTLLVRNSWRSVEMDALVKAQIELFPLSIRERIVFSGPEVRLAPASAQALGMALHELIANARAFGALSEDQGEVRLDWRFETDDRSNLVIEWTESGVEMTGDPTRKGFGFKIIKGALEAAVSGKVEMHFPPTGLRWKLTAPAEHILDL